MKAFFELFKPDPEKQHKNKLGWELAKEIHSGKGVNIEKCLSLIEQGANPNTHDEDGSLPLNAAVGRGFYPLIHALILAGADPENKNFIGKNARDVAELHGTEEEKQKKLAAIEAALLEKKLRGIDAAAHTGLAKEIHLPPAITVRKKPFMAEPKK